MTQFLILLAPLLLIWLLLIRPAQKRQRAAVALRDSLHPGQDIVTTAGLLGTITAVTDEDVTVSVAPGVELRMLKAAVGQVRSPAEPDEIDSVESSSPPVDDEEPPRQP